MKADFLKWLWFNSYDWYFQLAEISVCMYKLLWHLVQCSVWAWQRNRTNQTGEKLVKWHLKKKKEQLLRRAHHNITQINMEFPEGGATTTKHLFNYL